MDATAGGRPATALRRCPRAGCDRVLFDHPTQAVCRRCWAALPAAARRELARAYDGYAVGLSTAWPRPTPADLRAAQCEIVNRPAGADPAA